MAPAAGAAATHRVIGQAHPGTMALAAGTTLGPYTCSAPWARAHGEVYRAHDTRLGRDVAVKVLPATSPATPSVGARFEREARAVAALDHPHICGIHDVGEATARLSWSCRCSTGNPGRRDWRRVRAIAQALTIATEIAGALDKAHRHGIVHRDLNLPT